jgi:hypothetical protein
MPYTRKLRAAGFKQTRRKPMSNPIKHYVLTPSESEEKALIVEQMRINPRGPWVNGKKTNLPKLKRTTSNSKKKN